MDEEMKINEEDILYIEYSGNNPYSVVTTHSTWDCELDAGGDLLMFNSGMGKNFEEKDGVNVVEIEINLAFPEAADFKLWVNKKYTFIYKGMKGAKIIDKPISYKGHDNPYIEATEVFALVYCKECKAYYCEWGCNEHPEEDE